MTTKAAGFIVHDGLLVHASGATRGEAEADLDNTCQQAGLTNGWAATLTFTPATADLLALVGDRGGAISWREVDGIACTL